MWSFEVLKLFSVWTKAKPRCVHNASLWVSVEHNLAWSHTIDHMATQKGAQFRTKCWYNTQPVYIYRKNGTINKVILPGQESNNCTKDFITTHESRIDNRYIGKLSTWRRGNEYDHHMHREVSTWGSRGNCTSCLLTESSHRYRQGHQGNITIQWRVAFRIALDSVFQV